MLWAISLKYLDQSRDCITCQCWVRPIVSKKCPGITKVKCQDSMRKIVFKNIALYKTVCNFWYFWIHWKVFIFVILWPSTQSLTEFSCSKKVNKKENVEKTKVSVHSNLSNKRDNINENNLLQQFDWFTKSRLSIIFLSLPCWWKIKKSQLENQRITISWA